MKVCLRCECQVHVVCPSCDDTDRVADVVKLVDDNARLKAENERLNYEFREMGIQCGRLETENERLKEALGNLADINNYVYTMESTYFIDPDTGKRMTTVQYAKLKGGEE